MEAIVTTSLNQRVLESIKNAYSRNKPLVIKKYNRVVLSYTEEGSSWTFVVKKDAIPNIVIQVLLEPIALRAENIIAIKVKLCRPVILKKFGANVSILILDSKKKVKKIIYIVRKMLDVFAVRIVFVTIIARH